MHQLLVTWSPLEGGGVGGGWRRLGTRKDLVGKGRNMILSELVNEEEIKEGILLVHFCLLVVKLFCGVAFFFVPSSLPKRIRFLRISRWMVVLE